MFIIVRTNRTSQWMPFNNNNNGEEEERKLKWCQISADRALKTREISWISHTILLRYGNCWMRRTLWDVHQSKASNCDQLIKLIASFVEISHFNADVSISDSFMRINSKLHSYTYLSTFFSQKLRAIVDFLSRYCIFQRHHYIIGIVLQLVCMCVIFVVERGCFLKFNVQI